MGNYRKHGKKFFKNYFFLLKAWHGDWGVCENVLFIYFFFKYIVQVSNIEESLVKGKEAVALDTQDGMSWSILGKYSCPVYTGRYVLVYIW